MKLHKKLKEQIAELTEKLRNKPHLFLRSGTSQTWWRLRRRRWPAWRRGTPAADGAGWCCPYLLLPEEGTAGMRVSPSTSPAKGSTELNSLSVQTPPPLKLYDNKHTAGKTKTPPFWFPPLFTLEAATSCAVLAAISREHTINSSNFPLPCTTRSAASLQHRNTELNQLRTQV